MSSVRSSMCLSPRRWWLALELWKQLCPFMENFVTRPVGLYLYEGVVRDNKKAGVLEPAMSKIKSLTFATEAVIAILTSMT
ncbi:hypothetical protein BsWGS_10950 [Bradybaena similaris]